MGRVFWLMLIIMKGYGCSRGWDGVFWRVGLDTFGRV